MDLFEGVEGELDLHVHLVAFHFYLVKVLVVHNNLVLIEGTIQSGGGLGLLKVTFLLLIIEKVLNELSFLELSQLIGYFHKEVPPGENGVSQVLLANLLSHSELGIPTHKVQIGGEVVVLKLHLATDCLYVDLLMQFQGLFNSILTNQVIGHDYFVFVAHVGL